MLDLTVIVLTYNEEIHIKRCIERVKQTAKRIVIIDSYSSDSTVSLCQKMGVDVIQHEWPGNQAEQFNWALQNLDIDTEWILRLDADEYLSDDLQNEMSNKLPHLSNTVSGIVLPLGRVFMGRLLKHGIAQGVEMIRIFRTGKAYYEKRLMDEHLVVNGDIVKFDCKFIDDSLLSITDFITKHNKYAIREAALLLDNEYNLSGQTHDENMKYCKEVEKKRSQKDFYANLPLFVRPLFYFLYRYILKFGFLDGREGFLWDFFQGLWYRMLVDVKVFEIKHLCKNDKLTILQYLNEKYKINF